MLLAIDIGNSTASFGLFEGRQLVSRFSLPALRGQTAAELHRLIGGRLPENVSAVIISTVVTELAETYRQLAEAYLRLTPVFVDHTFDLGFSIDYHPPSGCGADRLVAAFAAVRKYGIPVIVCDFGTATTIDAVSRDNEYVGGIIAPGIRILAEALAEKTSKLPEVAVEKTDRVFGNTTAGSIRAGIYFGYIGLVEGIIRRMQKELAGRPRVIATGGAAGLIADATDMIEIVEKDLILEGLSQIHVLDDQPVSP